MTAGPQDLAPAAPQDLAAKERISADVPADVAHRLRMWAALRRTKAAHIVCELVCQAVPTAGQLATQMQNGAGNGDADH
jgi:hypothetical protein